MASLHLLVRLDMTVHNFFGMYPDRLELLLRLGITKGLVLGITLASLSGCSFSLVRHEIGIPELRALHNLKVCVVIPRNILAGSDFAICGFGLVKHPAEKLSPQEDTNRLHKVNEVMTQKIKHTFRHENILANTKYHNRRAKNSQ